MFSLFNNFFKVSNEPEFTNHGKRWTNEENDELLKLVSEKKSLEEMSIIHKRTQTAIWLQLLNIAKKMLNEGKSIEEVSELVSIDIDKLNEYMSIIIKEYNDTSILVHGESIKSTLKRLGGKWNSQLNGWILDKSKRDDVNKLLNIKSGTIIENKEDNKFSITREEYMTLVSKIELLEEKLVQQVSSENKFQIKSDNNNLILAIESILSSQVSNSEASKKFNVSEDDITNYFKNINIKPLINEIIELEEKQRKEGEIHSRYSKLIGSIVERQKLSKQRLQEYSILQLQINNLQNKLNIIVRNKNILFSKYAIT